MQALLKGWSVIRLIRLVAGVAILGYGYSIMDWLLIMIGVTLAIMSLANAGCGPFASSCATDYKEPKGRP